jgi:hypothetical protein
MSGMVGLLESPAGKLLLQTVGAQVAQVLGKAVADQAGVIVSKAQAGIVEAQALLDKWDVKHPMVQSAVESIRKACAGIILVPTEEQIAAALEHMVGSLVAALLPGPASVAAAG